MIPSKNAFRGFVLLSLALSAAVGCRSSAKKPAWPAGAALAPYVTPKESPPPYSPTAQPPALTGPQGFQGPPMNPPQYGSPGAPQTSYSPPLAQSAPPQPYQPEEMQPNNGPPNAAPAGGFAGWSGPTPSYPPLYVAPDNPPAMPDAFRSTPSDFAGSRAPSSGCASGCCSR